jgi:phage baseplate assembly protein W
MRTPQLRAERLLDDELQRYIEYLQRILSTPGFERAHDTTSFRAWVENNRPQLEAIAQLSGGSSATADEMEMALALYEPRSQFDSFTAEAIFGPILATVLSAAS